MKNRRYALLLLALLALYGCVSLTGQRITWFHDALKDTFYILIQYDGIHEGKGSNAMGKNQIPKFIADGDIMILDWFLHMERDEIDRSKASTDPVESAAARLVDRVDVEVLGRYREPDGRVGAAQIVTIKDFKAFLKEGNRLINAALTRLDREALVARAKKIGELWRTLDNILGAAQAGHTWVVAKGHSLQVTVPFHRDEWAETKGMVVLDLMREVAGEISKDAKSKAVAENLIRSLAGVPFSLSESGGIVTLTVGDPKAPRTFHIQFRDEYNKKLEPVVTEHVKTDLDAELRELLFDRQAKASASLRRVKHWMPPEVEVAALLEATRARPDLADAAKADATVARDRAIKQLHAFGRRWNEDQGHPEAPNAKGVDQTEYLKAWAKWYARRRHLLGNPAW